MTSEILRWMWVLTFAASVGILAALLARVAIRRLFGAAVAYRTWWFVPAALLAVLLPHARTTAARPGIDWTSLYFEPITALDAARTGALANGAGSLFSITLAPWLLLAWLGGAALACLYLLILQRAFSASLGVKSGSGRIVRATRAQACPAVLGLLRPRIVLPADFRFRYTPRERMLIIAHERTHIRRGDILWNALAALLRCCFWFNPLVHWGAQRFRADQEFACDAAVMRDHPGARRSYASAMLKTELHTGLVPLGCNWRSADDLKRRIHLLNRATPSTARRRQGAALAVLASVAVAYTAWAAAPRSATPEPGASAAPDSLHLSGSLFARHMDDHRLLVGFSPSVYPGHDSDVIEHLFLFTADSPLTLKLTLDHSNAVIDYDRRTGLHVNFTAVPGPGPIAISCVQRQSGSCEEPLAGLFLLPNSRAPEGPGRLPAHYAMQGALTAAQFWTLEESTNCNAVHAPCIVTAERTLAFPN
jgi:beta-lactamase regulating signal transducer with metallopeptidase domain